ncbi:MAG: DUF421 domain-containing protein [Desulfitobacteriaceae bacterium]|nr:DUF421 domain-containing protein [Desulfitobacteriaceae bacterium]
MVIFLRTIGLLLFAILCFRLMGFRSLGGDVEPIDFVIVLGIAEILGAPLADENLKVVNALIAIGTLTILQIILSYLSLKNQTFLRIIEGQPITVIKEGKILKNNMRKARFSMQDLMEELRIQGLTTVQDVELANLEPSGRFSVIRTKDAEPITPRYLGQSTSVTLIENGQVVGDKLEQVGINPRQLAEILSQFGITALDQVETAVIVPSGHIAVTKKNT